MMNVKEDGCHDAMTSLISSRVGDKQVVAARISLPLCYRRICCVCRRQLYAFVDYIPHHPHPHPHPHHARITGLSGRRLRNWIGALWQILCYYDIRIVARMTWRFTRTFAHRYRRSANAAMRIRHQRRREEDVTSLRN